MLKRIFAMVLALTLCFVFVGCGAKTTDSGEDVEYTYTLLVNKPDDWETNFTSYFEQNADGDPVALTGDTAPEFVANKYLARGVVQKEQGENTDDGNASSSDKTPGKDNAGTSGNTSKVEATSTKTTKFAADPYSDVPESVKGTTVEYLLCREITDNDKAMVADFEKKTGIKVKLTYAAYGTYGDTVATRIATKNSPDIINAERLAYPKGLLTSCEPMDVETFKLEDSFWDLESMQACKINGKYYGVISKKDIYLDARMIMVNVPLLKQILGNDYATKSPRALWKAGKWDLEALYDLCTTIKKAGYTPLTNISQYDFALASGQDLVKYDGTKFVTNLDNTDLRKAWEWAAQFYNSNGYMEGYNQNNFLAKKDVMFINTVYNSYNKNSIAGMADFEVDAVPVPGINGVTHAPCDFRPFSIAKGAKNPVGAAYFLRYLLDAENNFAEEEAVNKNVWETATYVSQQLPKTFEFSSSLLLYISDTAEAQVRTKLFTSKQISTAFESIDNQVANAVKKVNRSVLKVK